MIQITMIEDGTVKEVTTHVYCDVCGRGLNWEKGNNFSNFVTALKAKMYLREKGWKFGKVHKCPNCIHSKGDSL